jgi:hypothetical protein
MHSRFFLVWKEKSVGEREESVGIIFLEQLLQNHFLILQDKFR